MSSMQEYYETMTYRELQKIAKDLKIPANLKKIYLVEVITAQKANNEGLVKQITETAFKERLESAGTRRIKKTPMSHAKTNIGQSRIAPRDPLLILTDTSYNTRQTRSRHKTIQHFQPKVQCTNLSSMHLLASASSSATLNYRTVSEKTQSSNPGNSSPHVRRNSVGKRQNGTVLETLLQVPTTANLHAVAAECSQEKDPCFSKSSNNWKNQWIAGTTTENNGYMGTNQHLNQPTGSRECGSTLTSQPSTSKIPNFKIPLLKSIKRTSSSRQNLKQKMIKNNHNIAKEMGLQIGIVNTNRYSGDYTTDLDASNDNPNNFMHEAGISEMNDPELPCYLSGYASTSNIENYHNYQDDTAFFSHNLGRDMDQMNPSLSTMTDHSSGNNQSNFSLYNLNQADGLFDMLESESQNSSYVNICNQGGSNNGDPMNMDYGEDTFGALSGGSIIISQHSISPFKQELLSQGSNADNNEERDIPCSIKSTINNLPASQPTPETLSQYDDYILRNTETTSQNDNLNFAPNLHNISLTRIPVSTIALGMMDDDIPIADNREIQTSQPGTGASDLMQFYRKYGRWEEPYRPMRGTATAILCFLCNWLGLTAKFEEHLKKKHTDDICTTFHGMMTVDVNLGALASGKMLNLQQILIEHGNHLFVLRFQFKPPDTVCALMLMIPPKGMLTLTDPFPAIVHIQAVNQDTQAQVLWSGPIECLNEPNRPTNVDIFANRCNGRFEVMMRELNIVSDSLHENDINLEGLSLTINVYIQTLEDVQKETT